MSLNQNYQITKNHNDILTCENEQGDKITIEIDPFGLFQQCLEETDFETVEVITVNGEMRIEFWKIDSEHSETIILKLR